MRRSTPRRRVRKSGRTTVTRSFVRHTNATDPVVSVIIPAMNEQRTIRKVIMNAFKVHPSIEVIVVVNGSSDGTRRIAARTGARLIVHAQPLGHDVGRSIGARAARGHILLFLDADIVIAASDLRALVEAVQQGVDVALNRYEGPRDRFDVHSVILAKHVLNIALKREDLGGTSLTTIPHAMSRKALETIGVHELCVPPKAHTIAALSGLNIRAVHYIDVGRRNPQKRKLIHAKDPLEQLIIGDHLEAIGKLTAQISPRGYHQDMMRNRSVVR